MTTTATRDPHTLERESAPATTALVPPPRLRRRPALIAGALVAICLGAVLAAWAWTTTTSTQEVLAARHTIARGTVIEAGDLERIRINADPALHPLPASAYDATVGKRAALDIGAGGLLTADATTASILPPTGSSVVGVALTPAQAPGLPLQTGDKVRVVLTPAKGAGPPAGAPVFSDAEVVGTHADQATGELVVDLLVPHADAAVLAARVATGNVALVLDSGVQ